jgi:predicted NUDIX family phosphoesterase/dephospho-CoA kinase
MSSEFLEVAKRVFEARRTPMTPRQIVDFAISQKMFSDKRAGKTPHQTMKSKLSVHIRKHGDASSFVRTAPGRFYLRSLVEPDQTLYEAVPYQKSLSGEDVLVFDTVLMDETWRFQGIQLHWKKIHERLFRRNNCKYLDRLSAESSNSHKQLLTYVLVTRGEDVLSFRRGNYNRTEDYLKGSECIGFGGHVSQRDVNLFSTHDMGLEECVVRELSEELALPEKDLQRIRNGKGLSCIGVLNDDSSDVGRRHFAFLYRYEVSDDPHWQRPVRGEKSITQLKWLNTQSVVPIWLFEYWSQLCLRTYFPHLVRATPAARITRKKSFSQPHLLCVLGAVGSGKTELTRLLCRDYGYEEVNSGRVLASLLGIPPVPQTPRNEFQRRAWTFIQEPTSPQTLAAALSARVKECSSDRVLIDGIRQRATLDSLIDQMGKAHTRLMYVHTLPDLAYQFYAGRDKAGGSIFDFLKIRQAPVEQDVEEFIGIADAVIYNWTGIRDYRRVIHTVMRELQIRRRRQ